MRTPTALLALSLFGSFSPPEPTDRQVPLEEGLPIRRCWKIVSAACTSCSESGMSDDECKRSNNGPYATCVTSADFCTNGAKCDGDTGFNAFN